jgi:hypothetical protein
MMNLVLEVSLSIPWSDFLRAVKSYMGTTALVPLRRKRCCGFFLP